MGRPKAPRVPTAGENFSSALTATLENQQAIRDMERADQLFDIETMRSVSPQWTQLLLDFERDYGPQVRNAESAAVAQTRGNDLANILSLSPQFNQAVSAADPQSAAIRDMLSQQVLADLSAGAGMTPELSREVEQGVRRGQSARGMTRGTAPVAQEAFARGSRGLALKQQRQAAADNFLRTTAATRPDAFQFNTGRGGVTNAAPSMAPQTGMNVFQSALGQTQESNMLQSQLSHNAAQSDMNRKYGLLGSMFGAAGNMFSGGF